MSRLLIALVLGAATISAKRLGPSVLVFAFIYVHTHEYIAVQGIALPTSLSFFSIFALICALAFIVSRTKLSLYSAQADHKALPFFHPYVLRWINEYDLGYGAIWWKSRSILEICKNGCMLAILSAVVAIFFGKLTLIIPFILMTELIISLFFVLHQQKKTNQKLSAIKYLTDGQLDILSDAAIVASIVLFYLVMIETKDFLSSSVALLLISRFAPCFRSVLKHIAALTVAYLRDRSVRATRNASRIAI